MTWDTDLRQRIGKSFNKKFKMKELSAGTQFIVFWITLSTPLLIHKEQEHKHRMLTEKTQESRLNIHLENHVAKATGVSKSSTRQATLVLKLRPHKTTAIHALQPRDTATKDLLLMFSTVFRRRWDRSTVTLFFSWSVVRHYFLMKRGSTLFSHEEWFDTIFSW
jgi:hypothetical protein